MGPTIKEKKCAVTVTNQCLLIYISGQNTGLYNLKISNINNKIDFTGPTIISLLRGGGREFSMQDEMRHVPNSSQRPGIGLWPYM